MAKTKRCPYLGNPVIDPCSVTDEQCPKQRSKRRITMYCFMVPVETEGVIVPLAVPVLNKGVK